MKREAWKQGMLGATNALFQILAARFAVMVAIFGAIGLTWVTLPDANTMKLIALAIYCFSSIGGTVWLAGR
jgi:hypothetical protein